MPAAPIPQPPRPPISHALVYAGPTNPPQINVFRNNLTFLNQPAQPQISHLPTTGLLIVLSSWGGNTFEARSLYGLIRTLSYPIEIHASGVIQSAAIPLILSADHRSCTADTTFMFHPWMWGTEAHTGRTLEDLQQTPMLLEDYVKWGKQTLNDRSGLKHADIERLKLFDASKIYDANFALKNGIVHEIVERKIPAGIMTWNMV